MPAFPDLNEHLSDGTIELRMSSEWDIPDILVAHEDDRQLHRRLGLARPPSGAELGRREEAEPARRATGAGVLLTIVEPGDNTCRGQIDVHGVSWETREAELGIWVVPQLRGTGVARRALRLATAWLAVSCGLERLMLLTGTANEPMRRAALAAGFGEDGTADRDGYELVRMTLTISRS